MGPWSRGGGGAIRGISLLGGASGTSEADVTICGCGLVGASTALHLARKGLKVVLLDQSKPANNLEWDSAITGSSWLPWQNLQTRKLAMYSKEMYGQLMKEFSSIDMKPIDRIFLASSDQSITSLRRMQSLSIAHKKSCTFLERKTIAERFAHVNTADLKGGVCIGGEYTLNPNALLQAILDHALKAGVHLMEECRAMQVVVDSTKRVIGVDTSDGYIHAPIFVDASGIWSGHLPVHGHSEVSNIRVPQHPCSYSAIEVCTNPTTREIMHDMDGGLMCTPSANPSNIQVTAILSDSRKPVFTHDAPDTEFEHENLGPDWDSFHPTLERLINRFPNFKDVTFDKFVRGVESYSPDGYPILGESSIVHGYFVATAMNGHGVSLAGGVGQLLAEWINPGLDFLKTDTSLIDIARFLDVHSNKHYLQQRVPESAGLAFHVIGHNHNFAKGRELRKSPIYYQQKEAGAIFGEIMGYERPIYFGTDKKENHVAIGSGPLMGKPVWFHAVQYEYEACRERVGLIDMSNFSKFDIFSEDEEVVFFLQRLCSADIDKPIGSTVYTGMQNEMGGYVTDCTLSRLSHNHFFMIAPTVQQIRCRTWMERHLPPHSRVVIQDVTSMYTALNVIGPSSRQLLEDLTDNPMGLSQFPAFTIQEINVGAASNIRAISVTHCGELGWVLYVPNELAQRVYEDIVEAGKGYGLQPAGYYTLRQLRIEKFYVYWGMDIDWTTTPMQCGRIFRVSMHKPNFIGRNALLHERKEGLKRRFVQLLVDKHQLHSDPWPQGGEPIYRNGVLCGMTTTAGYGYTLGCQVCIGFIESKLDDGSELNVASDTITNGNYQVDIAGHKFPVRLNLNSPILPMISSEHPAHYRPTQ